METLQQEDRIFGCFLQHPQPAPSRKQQVGINFGNPQYCNGIFLNLNLKPDSKLFFLVFFYVLILILKKRTKTNNLRKKNYGMCVIIYIK